MNYNINSNKKLLFLFCGIFCGPLLSASAMFSEKDLNNEAYEKLLVLGGDKERQTFLFEQFEIEDEMTTPNWFIDEENERLILAINNWDEFKKLGKNTKDTNALFKPFSCVVLLQSGACVKKDNIITYQFEDPIFFEEETASYIEANPKVFHFGAISNGKKYNDNMHFGTDIDFLIKEKTSRYDTQQVSGAVNNWLNNYPNNRFYFGSVPQVSKRITPQPNLIKKTKQTKTQIPWKKIFIPLTIIVSILSLFGLYLKKKKKIKKQKGAPQNALDKKKKSEKLKKDKLSSLSKSTPKQKGEGQ